MTPYAAPARRRRAFHDGPGDPGHLEARRLASTQLLDRRRLERPDSDRRRVGAGATTRSVHRTTSRGSMTQTTPEPVVADKAVPLSARLRDETADVHRAAERSAFISALLGGKLDLREYARLVVQLRAVYEALEDEVAASTDAALAPLFAAELVRLPALTRDLEHLAGPSWSGQLDVLPSAAAYADRIRLVARAEHEMLLAHHYVRYLGDLSGGQLIGRALRRIHHLPDERGTEGYRFESIVS